MTDALREVVEKAMRARAGTHIAGGLGILVCEAVAVAVELVRKERERAEAADEYLRVERRGNDALIKERDEARKALTDIAKLAQEIADCPNGMCGHCIEILGDQLIPRCAPEKGGHIMPMSFPDMESLLDAARRWKFRQPNGGETEIQYRRALADFVQPKDLIESQEIRTGEGWDRWNDGDKRDLLNR